MCNRLTRPRLELTGNIRHTQTISPTLFTPSHSCTVNFSGTNVKHITSITEKLKSPKYPDSSGWACTQHQRGEGIFHSSFFLRELWFLGRHKANSTPPRFKILTFRTAVTSYPQDMSTHENMATEVRWKLGELYTTARRPAPRVFCRRNRQPCKFFQGEKKPKKRVLATLHQARTMRTHRETRPEVLVEGPG